MDRIITIRYLEVMVSPSDICPIIADTDLEIVTIITKYE